MKDRVIALFQLMAEHTAPKCATTCRVPHSCCDSMYCDLTEQWAKEQGVTLQPTDHPTLKFMGPTGCTVAPHLRPTCTLHNCHINGIGFLPGDEPWTERYFAIREEIDQELFRESYDEPVVP